MSDGISVPPRVETWREAWQSGEAARVAALYAADGTHESAKVTTIMPAPGRPHLRGRAEIEAYALRAFARVHPLSFEIERVTETEDVSVVEYLRHAPDVEPMRVCEVLRWRGRRLASVRVYHF
ncbi:MAG: nuclear transport factor 2 family protein [Reyranellaceae bacterium]